jgi:hypothetical protein
MQKNGSYKMALHIVIAQNCWPVKFWNQISDKIILLLKYGIDINQQASFGHYAVRKRDINVIQLLLKYFLLRNGADANKCDYFEQIPI